MILPTKTYIVPKAEPLPETSMEKTTRIVREELAAAAEKRLIKATGLRAARLAKEAEAVASDVPLKDKAGRGTIKTEVTP